MNSNVGCFSTLRILATVKLITKSYNLDYGFSTLRILATVKLASLISQIFSVLVPLEF